MNYQILFESNEELIEKIRRELLALKDDAKNNIIPQTTSEYTGLASRINEILALIKNANN
jgi:hypothetical protein